MDALARYRTNRSRFAPASRRAPGRSSSDLDSPDATRVVRRPRESPCPPVPRARRTPIPPRSVNVSVVPSVSPSIPSDHDASNQLTASSGSATAIQLRLVPDVRSRRSSKMRAAAAPPSPVSREPDASARIRPGSADRPMVLRCTPLGSFGMHVTALDFRLQFFSSVGPPTAGSAGKEKGREAIGMQPALPVRRLFAGQRDDGARQLAVVFVDQEESHSVVNPVSRYDLS